MDRSLKREHLFKLLFAIDYYTIDEIPNYYTENYFNINGITREKDKKYIVEKLEDISSKTELIDSLISKSMTNWSIDTISRVALTLLRLSTYEMYFTDEVPVPVSINEAVELAKKYGEDNSAKFINGVLAKIVGLIEEKNE